MSHCGSSQVAVKNYVAKRQRADRHLNTVVARVAGSTVDHEIESVRHFQQFELWYLPFTQRVHGMIIQIHALSIDSRSDSECRFELFIALKCRVSNGEQCDDVSRCAPLDDTAVGAPA